MGVLYTVFPLTSQVREYLASSGIDCPPDASRNPTPAEIRATITAVPGMRAQFGEPNEHGLRVELQASDREHEPWTVLNVDDYLDELTPISLSFEKGWPELILSVVSAIASVTGPLLLVPDTGAAPIVVPAHADVDALMASWEHTRPAQA